MGGDEGSSAAAVAISVSVGARKVLLEDVLLVAVHKARVDLHPASLEKACPCASNKKGVEDKAFDIRYYISMFYPLVMPSVIVVVRSAAQV